MKKTAIKNQTTIWVKVFEMIDHHASWSHQGRFHALEHLKEHLIQIVKDFAILDKVIKQPGIKAPTRKVPSESWSRNSRF